MSETSHSAKTSCSYLNQPAPKGSYLFDGARASQGLALNKMCFSFNTATARQAFLADERGYCQQFGLSEADIQAIQARDIIALLQAGASIYYLAKFAAMLGLTIQDLGGLQTGMSTEAFKQKLVDAGFNSILDLEA